MTYEDMSAAYRNTGGRGRYEACIKEQAQVTYADDTDPANAGLAGLVLRGDLQAVESVISAICTGPNSGNLDTDPELLFAVNAAWPVVSRAWQDGAS